jgi:Ca2+-binding RTX toxin-like protein
VTDDTNTLVDGGQIFISNGEDTYLEGTSYNDTLIGDINGADILVGGAGDDVYVVSSINQSLVEDSNGGIDTVITSVSGLSAYRGIEILEVDDQSSSYSSALDVHPFTQNSSSSFELTGGFDTLTILGGRGSDVLSSSGSSTLIGGSGDDVYIYTGSELIIENTDSGSDSVLTYASLTLPDNIEYVVTKSDSDINIIGNGLSNILVGNTSDNLLSGGAGNDTLVSMGGEDELIGGTGTDTFILSTNEIAYITDYEQNEAIIFALNEPPTTIAQVEAFSSSGSSDAAEWTYSDSTLLIDWNGDGSSDSMIIFGGDTSASDLNISVSSSFTSIL